MPSDYSEVNALLRDLRLGPYKNHGRVTFGQIVSLYWLPVLAVTAAFGLFCLLVLRTRLLNQRLQKSITDLKDQTEIAREMALEVLRQNAELAAILENAPAIILLVDEHGRLVRANKDTATLSGFAPEDLTGMLTGQVLNCLNASIGKGCGHTPQCENCTIRITFMGALRDGRSIRNQAGKIRIKLNEQRCERNFLVSASPIIVGNIRLALLTINDVTERKQMEEALRNSEARYRIVADNTFVWEYWLSPEGQFLYSSPFESSLRIDCWKTKLPSKRQRASSKRR